MEYTLLSKGNLCTKIEIANITGDLKIIDRMFKKYGHRMTIATAMCAIPSVAGYYYRKYMGSDIQPDPDRRNNYLRILCSRHYLFLPHILTNVNLYMHITFIYDANITRGDYGSAFHVLSMVLHIKKLGLDITKLRFDVTEFIWGTMEDILRSLFAKSIITEVCPLILHLCGKIMLDDPVMIPYHEAATKIQRRFRQYNN